MVIHACVIGMVSWVVLALVYRVHEFGMYIEGLKYFMNLTGMGRSSFLMGEHGTTGWLTYFPIVLMIKTAIPILIGGGILLFSVSRKKMKLPSLFWIPPVVFFVLVCFAKVQIGQRYILAVYPFILLWAGLGLAELKDHWRWARLPLLSWLIWGTWTAQPHYLSYFNEFIGGSDKGYQYLTDSNVDWGQGLKLLKNELSKEDLDKGIFLSYFGVAEPHQYGIRYVDIGSDVIAGHKDDFGQPGLKPTTFVISATNLQGTYYSNKQFFNWLEKYTPQKVIAHSLLVYDFSKQPEVIKKLEKIRQFS